MNMENGNGFAAWKAPCEAYQPDIEGRLLTGIIARAWGSVKEIDFLEAMETWEVQIRRYEVQSGEQVSDSTKIAVLMKHSPASVRSALRMAGSQIRTNYERAKKFLRTSCRAAPTTPTEVRAQEMMVAQLLWMRERLVMTRERKASVANKTKE